MTESSILEYSLLALAVASVVLPILSTRLTIPLFMVIARWIRWGLFATLFTFFMPLLELSFRPHWVHFITGLGLWFVLETGYNWIAIKALSRSEIPLFPIFSANSDGDEWPADAKYIALRDWLRSEKFNRVSALKAKLLGDAYLRASVYESEDQLTRIQILFIPKAKSSSLATYSITTQAENGRKLITDNMFLPYGGYYPSEWDIVRKPLNGSLKSLLKLHKSRLKKSHLQALQCEASPLEEINDQQKVLERLNIESGFLFPRGQREEAGKITYEGCYRLWKEMWLMAYLGRSI